MEQLSSHWMDFHDILYLRIIRKYVEKNQVSLYEVLPKISENLNIPSKPLALRTCATRCLFLYLSTVVSQLASL